MGWGKLSGFATISVVGVLGACGSGGAIAPAKNGSSSASATGTTLKGGAVAAPVATATTSTAPQLPVEQALKREASVPRKRYKIAFPNGLVLEPESTKEPLLKLSTNAVGQSVGTFDLTMDDAAITCVYNPNLLDLGDVMQRSTMPQIDSVSLKQIDFTLENAEGVPIPKWIAYFQYLENGAPVLGSVAVSSFFPDGGGTVVCSHYAMGYRVSTDAIMRGMALSQTPRVSRVYTEASRVIWNDIPVGFTWHRIMNSAQGYSAQTFRFVFALTGNGAIHEDVGSFAEVAKDGRFLRSGYSRGATDASQYSRNIVRVGEGEYEWSISHGATKDQGKVRGVITSGLEDARTLIKFLDGKLKSPKITFLAEDPVRIQQYALSKEAARMVVLDDGKSPERCEVDMSGRCLLRIDGTQRLERVFAVGQYPKIP